MPKVSEEYVKEKKNEIMNCALQLMQDIPLYQITMRDIIKKVGCSQGFIYRYYKGIDEIYVDLMNREIEDIEVKTKVKLYIENGTDARETVKGLIELLGDYILTVQERIGGKFYFEILVNYAFDEKKQKELLPTLLFKQNLMYIQMEIVNYISKKIDSKVFTLSIPLETLAVYVGDTVDGISNHAALNGGNHVDNVRTEVTTLYRMLGDYVVNCLK